MYLQLNVDEARDNYKEKRNRAKILVRQVYDAAWSQFIGSI